jgi:hypothetical protein
MFATRMLAAGAAATVLVCAPATAQSQLNVIYPVQAERKYWGQTRLSFIRGWIQKVCQKSSLTPLFSPPALPGRLSNGSPACFAVSSSRSCPRPP